MDPTWGVLNFLFFILFVVVMYYLLRRKRGHDLQVEVLNDVWEGWRWSINRTILSQSDFKSQWKEFKKEVRQSEKRSRKKNLFFLEFDGDLRASGVDHLKEEITAILQAVWSPQDLVLVRLNSSGGLVQDYGLGASQLKRLRDAGLTVWVSVDRVAASGGYLMASIAHKIISAPFAVIGSIGVIAQVPNFHRLLKNWDIDYREYTAGEFKRTVSLLGEITPKGEQKFVEQLEATHQFFKDFVKTFRPNLKIDELSTGEYWYGQKALELGLIDAIQTTEDVLLEKAREGYQILSVRYLPRKSWSERLSEGLVFVLERRLWKFLSHKVL